mmetsp:Transcript_17762/g.33711  ORF Transcript_17762/g.33711 Transcript_17762/m.33711 type:complete len:366 (+) Transcript_17762:102-1199(+)|eukprot:scaffold2354_cov165-Amphora_coffeaeformis.AAC.3
MTRRVSHASNNNHKQQLLPRGQRRCLGTFCVVFLVVLSSVLFQSTDESGVLTPQDFQWLRENSQNNHKHANTVPVEGDPFQLATQQSYGYLRDISDESWRSFQQRSLTAPQYRFPEFPERAFGIPIRWFIKNLQPVVTCPMAERMGGLVDRGAFWMCEPGRLLEKEESNSDSSNNDTTPSCLVYSIGYSGAFEDDLVERLPSCEVHVMDPTLPSPLPLVHPHVHWHPWGLTSTAVTTTTTQTNSSLLLLTLPEIQQRLGHVNRRVDVLKLDCDRCAWATFRDWIPLLNATQILWQVVGLPSPKEGNTYHPAGPLHFADALTMLQDYGYAMFAKDFRQNGPRVALGYVRLHPDFWTQAKQFQNKLP